MNNKRPQKTTVWSLRVPVTLLQRVTKLAEKQSRTVANMARLLLEEALNGK